MKKLLYTILLSLGTFLLSHVTDYINEDKYFYDQVSLDSAFFQAGVCRRMAVKCI